MLVQIHGGGYVSGSAQSYPGDALVNASNGQIIYVSIQYRLGKSSHARLNDDTDILIRLDRFPRRQVISNWSLPSHH